MKHVDYSKRAGLIKAALALACTEFPEDRPPGPHDDAERDLADDRLLMAARAYVEAHQSEEPLPG